MTHLIDKAALVAEIEKRKKEAESNCSGYKSYDEHRCNDCTVGFYEEFLEILDTLEVKEVDLEKEIQIYIDNHNYVSEYVRTVHDVAKHFFELRLKVQKGE